METSTPHVTHETSSPEDAWGLLQQPAHPAKVEPRFRLLLAALDAGWCVEEPVYLRPRWSEDGPRVYHFILHHTSSLPPRLLSVPEGQEVERFVRDEGLQVVQAGQAASGSSHSEGLNRAE